MARDVTAICNEALGELPATLITSIDDLSQGARHCKRLYPAVVTDLVEAHDWDFAVRRIALAQLANDRPNEWGFAYALPTDMGSPRGLIPNYGTPAGAAFPLGFAGVVEQYQSAIEYRIANGRLYTQLEQATLEYVIDALEPAAFTSLFARAVAMELAARLVMPILNDRARQGDLVNQAELAKSRAIADDINRNPNNEREYVSDRARARQAGLGPLSAWA